MYLEGQGTMIPVGEDAKITTERSCRGPVLKYLKKVRGYSRGQLTRSGDGSREQGVNYLCFENFDKRHKGTPEERNKKEINEKKNIARSSFEIRQLWV